MFRTLAFLAAALLLGGCVVESQPTEAERALLLTSSDFGYDEDEAWYSKVTTYWTRTADINYHSAPLSELDLQSTISFTPNPSEAAIASFSYLQTHRLILGLATNGVSEEEIELSRDIGSQAKLILLRKGGKPIGNIFTASIGKKMVFIVFTGRHYFDSAPAFEAFIEPKLAALEAYEHDDPLVSWGKGLFSDDEDD